MYDLRTVNLMFWVFFNQLTVNITYQVFVTSPCHIPSTPAVGNLGTQHTIPVQPVCDLLGKELMRQRGLNN